MSALRPLGRLMIMLAAVGALLPLTVSIPSWGLRPPAEAEVSRGVPEGDERQRPGATYWRSRRNNLNPIPAPDQAASLTSSESYPVAQPDEDYHYPYFFGPLSAQSDVKDRKRLVSDLIDASSSPDLWRRPWKWANHVTNQDQQVKDFDLLGRWKICKFARPLRPKWLERMLLSTQFTATETPATSGAADSLQLDLTVSMKLPRLLTFGRSTNLSFIMSMNPSEPDALATYNMLGGLMRIDMYSWWGLDERGRPMSEMRIKQTSKINAIFGGEPQVSASCMKAVDVEGRTQLQMFTVTDGKKYLSEANAVFEKED